jgi:hypothetical protein
MKDATSDGSQASISGQGRRRPRQPVPRTRRVEVTLTGEEYTVIEARRHHQGRRPHLVRRRETGSGPELAQAAAALDPPRAAPGRPHLNLTAGERNAVWDQATRAAADAAAQIRNLAWTNPAAAADAAWAASDTLHVAAAILGSRILRQAADAYDRPPYGRIPPPSPAGNRLRQAARLLSAFACLTGDRSMAPIILITRLAALAEAVAELRHAQQHAAQAAAARTAADSCTPLHARHRPYSRARPSALALPPSSPGSPSPSQPGQRHQVGSVTLAV